MCYHEYDDDPARYVWLDFWCMPNEKPRTPREEMRFYHMLGNVNLLYIGCSVLTRATHGALPRLPTPCPFPSVHC